MKSKTDRLLSDQGLGVRTTGTDRAEGIDGSKSRRLSPRIWQHCKDARCSHCPGLVEAPADQTCHSDESPAHALHRWCCSIADHRCGNTSSRIRYRARSPLRPPCSPPASSTCLNLRCCPDGPRWASGRGRSCPNVGIAIRRGTTALRQRRQTTSRPVDNHAGHGTKLKERNLRLPNHHPGPCPA